MSSQSHQRPSLLTALPVLGISYLMTPRGCLSSTHHICIIANRKREGAKSMLLPFIFLNFYMTPSLTSQWTELNHMSTSNSKEAEKCSFYSIQVVFCPAENWCKKGREKRHYWQIQTLEPQTIGKLHIIMRMKHWNTFFHRRDSKIRV